MVEMLSIELTNPLINHAVIALGSKVHKCVPFEFFLNNANLDFEKF